ncbi:hypothetical protein ACFFLG_03620 [Shewanella indica]|uniref:hypothetical protein n=1 Tax=Shewanella TaxID=22 RepID=UPI000C334F10|nr:MULTISPECIES: hypothetical protein [Shewanella]TVL39697.1 hypothetical protein AYI98_21765 [Shewanella algae]GHA95968.1 hypothetical protein GCM10007107_06420 [Shewanella indica]
MSSFKGDILKGIPSTPTDNIYKFMAISGLWFIAGFIALYIWLVNTQIQIDKEALNSQAYFFSVNMERKIKNRLDSIEKGKLDENRLDWVPASYTPEQEEMFLSKALENHQETIKKNKDALNSDTGEELKLVERWDVRIAGALYILFMVGLTWFGFSRWVKNHIIDETVKTLDREIKEKSLKKLELEIQQLKLTNQSTSRLRRRTR